MMSNIENPDTPRASEPMLEYGRTYATNTPLHHPTPSEMAVLRASEADIKAGRLYTQEEVDKMVDKCPNPICPICGQRMNHAKMFFIDASCWRCRSKIKFALIRSERGENIDSTGFNNNEIALANQYGTNIKDVRTKDHRTAFYSVCNKCFGYNFTSFNLERLYSPETETIDLGKKCFHCVWKTNPQSISFFR